MRRAPRPPTARHRAARAASLGLALAAGCGAEVLVGSDEHALGAPVDAAAGALASDAPHEGAAGGAGASGASGAGAAGVSGAGGLGGAACVPVACAAKIYDCGNCVDDDLDGTIDALDPGCLGPCDDTEDSYFGGIPGENAAPCRQDCYFDGDTGSGNDGCLWDQRCDPLSVAPGWGPSGSPECEYDPLTPLPGPTVSCASLSAAQSASCEESCLRVVPNGCDCFGCCELPARSGSWVWVGYESPTKARCGPASIDDPELCRACTPVPSCVNPCESCEVCAGESAPPAGCSGADPRCAPGRAPCGLAGEPACEATQYCVTGCCADVPF